MRAARSRCVGVRARADARRSRVVAIFFVGFLYLGSLSSFTTIAQLRAPAALRGRVVSVLMMLIGALYPIGSIAQGAIADEIGLRATHRRCGRPPRRAHWRCGDCCARLASAALDEVGAEDTLIASDAGTTERGMTIDTRTP